MALDILLLTEDDSPALRTGEMNRILGATDRQRQLPHDVHLNVAMLAASVKAAGLTCEVVDNFIRLPNRRKRLEQMLAARPSAVGLSTTFLFREETIRETTDLIRRASPSSRIILGGPTMLQRTDFHRYGDIVVLGEGENVLPRLLRALRSGGSLQDLEGIGYTRSGEQVHGRPAPLLAVEEVPYPDWGHIDRNGCKVYPLETQRGCVYRCKFCTYPIYSPGNSDGTGLRLWPTERVIDEIRRNHERFGILNYRMTDATFTFPVKRAQELCRAMIKTRLPLRWSCYGRVDNMTPELASLMAEAGCRWVFFGVETGDAAMLKRMRKDFTLSDVVDGVRHTQQAKILALGAFLIGFPGETEESVANTENLIRTARFDFFRATTFWLDHNAPVWLEREKHGLTGWGADWSHRTMDAARAAVLTRKTIENILSENSCRLGQDYTVCTLVNMGLEYDEATRYIQDKSLIIAYRLAQTRRRPLDPFDAEKVRSAQKTCRRLALKMAALGKRHYATELPEADGPGK